MNELKNGTRVTFIGAGNMAEALVSGLVGKGVCPPESITVTDLLPNRLKHFEATYGVQATEDNQAAVKEASVVVLAVKPQVMGEVLEGIASAVGPETTVITIAAGIPVARYERALGDEVRVVRVMPNTPALVGAGAAAICGGRWAREEDLELAATLLRAVGIVVRVDEPAMDAVTALSGSGPAYVFRLVEAMLQAADDMGVEAGKARELVYATVAGAARLLQETGTDAATLRERVTSKGGTTAAALAVLQERRFFEEVVAAVRAAEKRSQELSAE